jgi:YidC/Oxa1 family membrane protein insertase
MQMQNQPENQKNLLLAIILSVAVLLAWQILYANPKLKEEQERQKRIKEAQSTEQVTTAPGSPQAAPTASGSAPAAPPGGQAPAAPGAAPAAAPALPPGTMTREAALAASPRVGFDTPALKGSINLRSGRIDDLLLKGYRETVDPKSANVRLLSPAEAPDGYFAEHGYVAAGASQPRLPGRDAGWRAVSGAALSPSTPVTIEWDNGAGLHFRRTFSVDQSFLFKIVDEIDNKSGADVTLHPYARLYRFGTPKIEGLFIQHEGLAGYIGDTRLHELTYADALKDGGGKVIDKATGGWIGIVDKYWATALIPDQAMAYRAKLDCVRAGKSCDKSLGKEAFQADYVGTEGLQIPSGQRKSLETQLFAGAKQVELIKRYESEQKIRDLSYLIDWGWFYFITKPLHYLVSWLYSIFGNFGFAILAVTVIIKALFFPLANKSYESMAKMKKLQPEMERLRERYKDDKAAQQKELMALYSKEKINPLAGCLPILLQIPVFFALYKLIFISIDMRHAPFFGWIKDLSAPDPTSLTNLFGLLPWGAIEVPLLGYTVGAWAIVMGITMWLQMQLNPQQPDPMQQAIFNWMPLMFTLMLAGFASGLVIYWAWNNLLSLAQQYLIMKRQGVDVPLVENLKKTFAPLLKLGEREGGKKKG